MKKIRLVIMLCVVLFTVIFMAINTSAFTSNTVDNQPAASSTLNLMDGSFELIPRNAGTGGPVAESSSPYWKTTDASGQIEVWTKPTWQIQVQSIKIFCLFQMELK